MKKFETELVSHEIGYFIRPVKKISTAQIALEFIGALAVAVIIIGIIVALA